MTKLARKMTKDEPHPRAMFSVAFEELGFEVGEKEREMDAHRIERDHEEALADDKQRRAHKFDNGAELKRILEGVQ